MSPGHDAQQGDLGGRDGPEASIGKGLWDFLNAPWAGQGAGQRVQASVGVGALMLFLAAIVVAGMLQRSLGTASAAVGVTAFLILMAATTVGAALGFLFGLPRLRSQPATDEMVVDAASRADRASRLARAFAANDNLTKVSDWLTTIVVGLTLINLSSLRGAVTDLATALEPALGGAPSSGIIGICLVVVGLVVGFITVYLWTSVSVRALLEESEAFKQFMRQEEAFRQHLNERQASDQDRNPEGKALPPQ